MITTSIMNQGLVRLTSLMLIMIPLVLNLKAQSHYDIDIISSNHGLPSDEINDVFQDSEGYLWFCTTEGLIRYDGYELKSFSIAQHHDKGLITNSFNKIKEDSKGLLWCATDRGVASLNKATEQFTFYNTQTKPPFNLSYDVLNTLVIDKDDNIWIGSSGAGVEVLSRESGIIETYNISRQECGMNSNWITNIYIDKSENVWIASWKGALTQINKSTGQINTWTGKDIPLNIPHFSPFSMIQGKANEYWLGLWDGGLINFTLQKDSMIVKNHLTYKEDQKSIAGDIIYDLAFDKDSNLWVGTPYGLTMLEQPAHPSPVFYQFRNNIPNRHLSQNEAYSLLCDASGLMWVGTSGGGVNKIDNKIKLFTPYEIPDIFVSRQSQSVSAFTKTPEGELLIGVRSLGFGAYDTKTESFTHYTELTPFNTLPSDLNTVNCFHWDQQGNLWLGTRYSGLIKFNLQTGQYLIINKTTEAYDFPSREIFDIYEDHLGYLWIGTENGLYKIVPFQPEKFSNFSVLRYQYNPNDAGSLSSNRISKILEDHHENLWVATFDHGINRLTSNIRTHYPLIFEQYMANSENGLITDHIITLFEDADKQLWVGSGGGGLFKWDSENSHFIPFNNHVSGNIIYNMEQDARGNLWIGTNRGLTRMNTDEGQIKSNYFLQENGLQSNIFNKGASYLDNEGNLFIGGNRGFNFFDPLKIKPDSFIPPVVITDIKVMGEPVQSASGPDDPLILNHFKNNISITFAALSFSQPENNKYSVKLEGLEDRWRVMDANTRTLNYANLKPGQYTLKIKGSNSHGYWNPHAEKLFIKVRPAPYKTWWAFTLYFLLFGGIIALIFRMERKNQQVKHALQIEHIERQKSEKLNHFKQGLFANISHEFLTPLNILSCLIDDWRHLRNAPNGKDLSLAERNINRLNRLNQQFLYYSKSEVEQLPLSVASDNLNQFVQNICDNFTPLARKKHIQFHCEIQCPESPVWFDHEKLDIILYNLLSNAFKFTPEEGSVNLQLSLKKEGNQTQALFIVKDSGSGISAEKLNLIFKRFQSFKSKNSNGSGFGIGLALTKSMIEAHKGTLRIDSVPENGTSVFFSIPINKKAFRSDEIVTQKKGHHSESFMQPEIIEEETLLRLKNLHHVFDEKPTVLIVEDNADFRKIIKSNIEKLFSVLEATNGITAYEMALNRRPDIIISDILMPAMDGLELCRKIKNSQTTTHIPVILLTAKSSDEEKAEGYRAGADSYMSKPFNINTLLARMEALLEQQKRTLNRIEKQKKPATVSKVTTKDDAFLQKARQVIENNLANPDFSVKLLAREVSMSNSMLYRKISDLLNINPNTFIRKTRMLKAAEMIEEGDLTISDVAFKCGFKDVSYFGVTFKKEFGVTPTQYQKKSNGVT